jgi:hypothetical protein
MVDVVWWTGEKKVGVPALTHWVRLWVVMTSIRSVVSDPAERSGWSGPDHTAWCLLKSPKVTKE